jgi:hypothetical protein
MADYRSPYSVNGFADDMDQRMSRASDIARESNFNTNNRYVINSSERLIPRSFKACKQTSNGNIKLYPSSVVLKLPVYSTLSH